MSTLDELIQNNASLSYIREQGYTVLQIIRKIYDRYPAEDYLAAGYTMEQILNTNGFFTLADFNDVIPIPTLISNYNFTLIDFLRSAYPISIIKPYFPLIDFYNIYIIDTPSSSTNRILFIYQLTDEYTIQELKDVGFTDYQLSGADDYVPENIYEDYLLLGIGYVKFRGFTTQQLKVAGFTVAELSPGYTIAEIKDGGYTARQMYPTFTVEELKIAGFTIQDFKTAEFIVAELYIGFTFQELYPIFTFPELYPSFSIQSMIDEGITLLALVDSGISYSNILLEVPYTEVFSLTNDIISAYDAFVSMKSVTVEELFNIASEYGISENVALLLMVTNGINLLEIYQYGNYSIEDIRPLYTTAEQKLNGYKIEDMILAGYSVSELYPSAGYTLREYYLAGVEGVELYSLGATANELIGAGYETYCLNTGTRILCVKPDGEEYEKVVEELKEGDIVKSYKHGNRKIQNICCGELINDTSKIRWSMYKMKESGLIMTGGHSIMVDKLSEEEYKRTISEWEIQEIDKKVLLMAGYSSKFEQIQGNEKFRHYNFNLENDGDENKRYGVYANGILVETPSEKIIKGFKTEK